MDWQDKYLCPLIEREKFSLKRITKLIKDFKILFIHAVSFHEYPKGPKEKLPDFKSQDIDLIYSVCREFYNNANDRIDKLEDKAVKLLSYISALFAFVSFAFINTSIFYTKIMLLISMILLIFSILISFRCVNIKGRKAFFIPDVYDFSGKIAKDNFNKEIISKKLLNSAIYNENIADNTADILKVSRYLLALAVFISVFSFLISINGYFKKSNTTNVKIENQMKLTDLEDKVDNTNKALNEINKSVGNLNDNKKFQDEIDTLSNELKSLKVQNDQLIKKLEEFNKEKKNSK